MRFLKYKKLKIKIMIIMKLILFME